MSTTFKIDLSNSTRPKILHFINGVCITVVKMNDDKWYGLIESNKRTTVEWTSDTSLEIDDLITNIKAVCVDLDVRVGDKLFRDLKGKMLAF